MRDIRKFLKHYRFLIIFLAITVGAVFLIWRYVLVVPPYVPKEFLEAKQQGAEIAGMIVKQSGDSNQKLESISRYDRSGEFQEALKVVGESSIINKELSQKAIELSKTLEQMTLVLAGIKPDKARSLAQEAIVYEINLIQHLISYNDLWNKLLETLRMKFEKSLSGPFDQGGNGDIKELVQNINKEIQAINELNQKFSKAMVEFDRLTS